MAHQAQREFCERVRALHPKLFENARVLDCGSLDVNGTNRYLFTGGTYLGVDVGAGSNVDVISKTHELGGFLFEDGSFDVVVSTECLEHDKYWEESLEKMVRLLRSGGLLLVTCATTGRPEHGTLTANPGDSPLTTSLSDWGDYYKNLTELDIRRAIDFDQEFFGYCFEVNEAACDLYFYGVKR